jgi:hypothetical protein
MPKKAPVGEGSLDPPAFRLLPQCNRKRAVNCGQYPGKTPKNPKPPKKTQSRTPQFLFRLESTPTLYFLKLTANFNRTTFRLKIPPSEQESKPNPEPNPRTSFLRVLSSTVTFPRRTKMQPLRRYLAATTLPPLIALFAAVAVQAQQKPTWDSTIDALAAKIAATTIRPGPVHLEIKNQSSLDPSRISDLRQKLEADLQHRGTKLVGDAGADATVQLTVTENLRDIIFAAQVQRNDSPEVVLTNLDRAEVESKSEGTQPVRLEREFIWSQPDPILDFIILPPAPDATPRLAVLEPRRLVIYRSTEGRWQPQESHPLPSIPAARDQRGTFTPPGNDPEATIGVDLPGAKCTLKTKDRLELACTTARDIRSNVETDSISLTFNCGAAPHALLTGDADWTRPDSLRVIEVTDHANQLGEAMAFSGPILALWPGAESKTARVIWRDLATGDYEAGIVTATCGP